MGGEKTASSTGKRKGGLLLAYSSDGPRPPWVSKGIKKISKTKVSIKAQRRDLVQKI